MVKIQKIAFNSFGIFLECFLILFILLAFLIRTSTFQTYLATKFTSYLSEELGTKIELEGLELIFFDKLSLNGIVILDQQKDTLISAKSILLTIDDFDLSKNSFDIGKVQLNNGSININRDKKSGAFNYRFLVDYFSGESDKKKPKKMILNVRNISVTKFSFCYDDYRVKPQKYGIDFSHMKMRNFGINLSHFAFKDDKINLKVNDFKFEEHSGFNLKKLNSNVQISSNGIRLGEFQLISSESNLKAPKLNLLFKDWTAFSHFNDSVIFDVLIDPSTLSMRDVSYFASDLEGMNSKLKISAELKNPLSSLKIANLDLRFGIGSFLRGTFDLPDFSLGKEGVFNANIVKSKITLKDIKNIPFPKSMSPIIIDETLSKLEFLNLSNASIIGKFNDFNLGLEKLETALGSIRLGSDYRVVKTDYDTEFTPTKKDTMAIYLDEFNLGKLINKSEIGFIDAAFQVQGTIDKSGKLTLPNIRALISKFEYNNYSYHNCFIEEASLKEDVLSANLKIEDANIQIDFKGEIGVGDKILFDFEANVKHINLGKLNFTQDNSIYLSTEVSSSISGSSFDLLSGQLNLNNFLYNEDGNQFSVPNFTSNFSRSVSGDYFQVNSSLFNALVSGKINYETVITDFIEEFSIIIPSISFDNSSEKEQANQSDFSFEFKTGELDDMLAIFSPGLHIQKGTLLSGNYNSKNHGLNTKLISNSIKLNDYNLEGINFQQNISKSIIKGDFLINSFSLNDSLKFDNVLFSNSGIKGSITSTLSWDPNSDDFSQIKWNTSILDKDHFKFILNPSFFSLKGLRWEIANQSEIIYSSNDLFVTDFKLARKNQFIKINGCLTKNNFDKLKIDIQSLDLAEISSVIGSETKMSGLFSGWGVISNPYTNFRYTGDAFIEKLFLNEQEVGDLNFQSDWSELRESIILAGSLEYKKLPSFNFGGNYALKSNELDFQLKFDGTDIQFANAFIDPSVARELNGKINGALSVKGSPDNPILKGNLFLEKGSVQVEMLGVNYKFNGKIIVVEDGIFINNLPIKDEEGNTASLVGSIYHKNFSSFNVDFSFNFEDDLTKRDILNPDKYSSLNKFKVLNTNYKDGDVYFGTAYARGTASVSGTANKMDVIVDLETEKGTVINFPMYGVSDIEESNDFIEFVEKGVQKSISEEKINFSGINLDLKFKINPNTTMKLIFDEFSGDEITAKGFGDINVKLDQLDHLTLNGSYNISEGSKYNFVMLGINQVFNIIDGSTISWNGDVLDANLDIKTSLVFKKISLLELSPETADKSLLNQDVLCYLNLSDKLLKPKINFDIAAPKAPETGKSLLRRVTNDQDELNRQFFSLLLVRKFQPLKGTLSANSAAAIDVVESQINAALGKLSENYKLNVDYGEDKLVGENSVEVGLKTGLLDDRLIISGSFGVENKADNATIGVEETNNQTTLIGDVNIEYLVNEKGTFRVNVFNESNANSVNQNSGPFSQGAGLSYHEEFNSWKDFDLLQFMLDIFRKKENKHFKIVKPQKKLPPLNNPN